MRVDACPFTHNDIESRMLNEDLASLIFSNYNLARKFIEGYSYGRKRGGKNEVPYTRSTTILRNCMERAFDAEWEKEGEEIYSTLYGLAAVFNYDKYLHSIETELNKDAALTYYLLDDDHFFDVPWSSVSSAIYDSESVNEQHLVMHRLKIILKGTRMLGALRSRC